jgi:putative FmdB family regulatory protein
MPLYDVSCEKCSHEFEYFSSLKDFSKKIKCEKCGEKCQRIISPRQKSPTFTEKLYPYFDRALHKRFDSPSERKSYLKANDLHEVPSKSCDILKMERMMYDSRIGSLGRKYMRHA